MSGKKYKSKKTQNADQLKTDDVPTHTSSFIEELPEDGVNIIEEENIVISIGLFVWEKLTNTFRPFRITQSF